VFQIDLSQLEDRNNYNIQARVETADGKLWGLNDTITTAIKAGKEVQRNGEVGIQVELKVI
jgi:uncharacterized lipoprotein YbaY